MKTAGETKSLSQEVLRILRLHLSPINATSALKVAEQHVGVQPGALKTEHLAETIETITKGLPFFLGNPKVLAACIDDLQKLSAPPEQSVGPSEKTPSSQRGPDSVTKRLTDKATSVIRLTIANDEDVIVARKRSALVSAELGFTALEQVKISTVVSELARNIVCYAKTGTLEITKLASPIGIEIVARDHGPGIANLDLVLSGRYRSKQGMGMGLRGTKNLVDSMDIQTAVGAGTTITVVRYRR